MKDNKHLDCPMCPKLSDQITDLKRQIIEDTPVIDAAFDRVRILTHLEVCERDCIHTICKLFKAVRNHPDYQEQKDSE